MPRLDSVGDKLRHAVRLDRAVRFVWDASRGWTVVNVALAAVQGVLPLAALYLIKLVVDAVTAAAAAPQRTAAAFEHVALLVGLAAAVAVVAAICQSVGGLAQQAQSLAVTDHVSAILHRKSIEVDLEYYETPGYYDALHRAQQEGLYRPTAVVNGLVRVGQTTISLVAMAGLLLSFHWAVALVLFAVALPGVLVRLVFSRRLFRWQRERTALERKAAYYNWLLTGDAHAKEIRLFGLGTLFGDRFADLRGELRAGKLKIAKRRSVAEAAAQAIGAAVVFGCYGLIAYRAAGGAITVGDMVMYFGAFQRGLAGLRDLLGSLAELYENNLFLANVYEFLDLEPKITAPADAVGALEPIGEGIAFEGVSFGYPAARHRVIENVSLTIGPREVVALVGGNGAGKTTLIKLLCRLYDPQQGRIRIDGVDLRGFDPQALRRGIGVVFQDSVQYQLSARENIWFGDVATPPDEARIAAAARRAGVAERITALPRGYDTTLGKWFEEGEQLSIGEWQKLALARAFVGDARILVLDEPTSSLDARAEQEMIEGFRELLTDRPAILISHRFSTVRLADRIYVLERGRIVEQGSHEALVDAGGTYARLFEKQARAYRR